MEFTTKVVVESAIKSYVESALLWTKVPPKVKSYMLKLPDAITSMVSPPHDTAGTPVIMGGGGTPKFICSAPSAPVTTSKARVVSKTEPVLPGSP